MSNDNYLKGSCKECGNHIEFLAQTAGTVVVCPHCGQWTELIRDKTETPPVFSSRAPASNGKDILLAVLLGCFAIALAVGGYFFVRNRVKTVLQPPVPPIKVAAIPTNPPPKPTPITPTVPEKRQKSPEDLKVGPVQLEKAKVGSLVYAVGTVTNVSDFQRFGVQVELDLFGKNGKKLGVAKDYKDVIEPNHEWQFHALIPDPRTASAKVSSVKED